MAKKYNDYMTFQEIVKLAKRGRTKFSYFGIGSSIGPRTYAVYYNDGRHESHAAIRLYNTNIITQYEDGRQEIDVSYGTQTTLRRVNKYIMGDGRIVYSRYGPLYFPRGDWRNGYFMEKGRVTLGPKSGAVYLPVNQENTKVFVYSAYGRMPLGKRWYFIYNTYHSTEPRFIFIHRCDRVLHGMKWETTVCSACSENAATTFPDLTDKIKSALAFRELKTSLKVGHD